MARRDFSSTQVVCNDSKSGRKQEGQQDRTATELLTKKRQNGLKTSFFDLCQKFKKICEAFLQE
jgi:hypothetical protein